LAALDSTPSIACVRASDPVAAVTEDGSVSSSDGSRTATRAASRSLAITSFECRAGSLKTAPRVISEPLPTVVGTTISGNPGCVTRFQSAA